MWGLSSLTRNRTCALCIGRWILKHWTTREVPLPEIQIHLAEMGTSVGISYHTPAALGGFKHHCAGPTLKEPGGEDSGPTGVDVRLLCQTETPGKAC